MLFLAALPESLVLIRHFAAVFGGFSRIYSPSHVGTVSRLLICDLGYDLGLVLMRFVLSAGILAVADECLASSHVLTADGDDNLLI